MGKQTKSSAMFRFDIQTACSALFRAASAGSRIRNKCAKLAMARGRRNYDSALVKRALHPKGRKEGPNVEAIWPQKKRGWNADFVWDGIFISFSTRLSAKEITASKRMSILCTDLLLARLLCSLCSHSAIGHGTRPIIGGAVVFLFLNKLNNRSLPRSGLQGSAKRSPRLRECERQGQTEVVTAEQNSPSLRTNF